MDIRKTILTLCAVLSAVAAIWFVWRSREHVSKVLEAAE